MTYPPQPGQPGYGQQQPSGFPQPGGFPPPGQQPYGQPGFGQPAPGFSPGGRSKKGLWIGLSAGLVVILAAVGITGFWKPGFFRGKASDSSAQGVAQQVIDGFNQRDRTKLAALKCADADPSVQKGLDDLPGDKTITVRLTGGAQVNGNKATAAIAGTIGTFSGTGILKLANETSKWCWQDWEDSTSSSSGGSGSSAQAVAQQVVDGLNRQNKTQLTAVKCADANSGLQQNIDGVTDTPKNLRLTGSTQVNGNQASASIAGTDGTWSGTGTLKFAKENGRWCWQDWRDD